MGGREEESREAGGKGRAAGRKVVGHIVRGDLQSGGCREEGKGGKGAMVFKKAGATNEEECGRVMKGRRGLSGTARPC